MKRRISSLFAAGGVFTLLLAFCAMQQPAGAQFAIGPITQTFTTSGSNPIQACGLKGNSATFQATGTGPIDAQVSNDGFSWTPATITTVAGAVQAQPLTPTSGTVYQVTPLNADCVRILPDTTWGSQSVTVTFKASTSIAAVATPGSGSGGSTNATIVAPTDAAGNVKVAAPAPSATQQVGCDTAAHCPVNANQVTSPWVVTTPPPYTPPTCSPGVNNGACSALPTHETDPNGTVGTCTTVSSIPTYWLSIVFRATQTGAISLYNDVGSCTTLIMTYTATAAGNIPFPVNYFCSVGLSYKWATAVEVGNVWIATTP